MKLLIRAALRARKNIYLLIFSICALFFLTVANQIEIFAIGLMTDTGANVINAKQVERVVSGEDGVVKEGAVDSGQPKNESFPEELKKKETNPLALLKSKVREKFDIKSNIRALICVLIGVAVFKAFWLFTSRYLVQLIAVRFARDLRQEYFRHIQTLSMSFFQKYNIGALSSRVVGDSSQISMSINSSIANFFQTPFTVLSTFSICLYLSWKMSLIVFVGAPAVVVPIVIVAKRIKRVARQIQGNQESFTSVLIDFLSGVQTVKVFGMEEYTFSKYKQENDYMGVLEGKNAKYSMMTRPILHAVTTFCLATVLIVGLNFLDMSPAEVFSFCGLLYLMYEPIKRFADENSHIQRGIVAADRMFEVLNLKPEIEDAEDAIELPQFEDEIVFDRVSFKYENEWIIKDLSFTVKKGETVALVGPTGAGKSTIVQLLPRLYDVQEGEIRIDGKPLQAYTQESVRKQISFVAQKPFLFLDTIKENIAYGNNYTDEEIELAAKRAYAHEFIDELPNGYQTVLKDAGSNLSGGQQQRLAIARALAKKAPILILDEATSALDSVSENRIKTAIQDLHGSMTQLIIAHRLGTIEHADKIVYLEKGQKVAEGTKDELLETCPQFRLAWQANFGLLDGGFALHASEKSVESEPVKN